MAVTILAQPISPILPPATRMRTFQLTFSGTYAAPGETITAANLGMSLFYNVQATESITAYFANVIPTTPSAQDGAFATFTLQFEDGTQAGAVVQLANGAYPAPITGGVLYLLALGR